MAVKALPITLDKDDSDNDMEDTEWYNQSGKLDFTTYTKHYYIGSERISSALGTIDNLGALCADIFQPEVTDQSFMVALIQTADQKIVQAAQTLQGDYNYFEKQLNLPSRI